MPLSGITSPGCMHKCKHVQLQTEKRKVKTQCLQLHLLNGQKYHGLRSSASPVLTATGLVNGRWQFLRPTESTPLDRSPKNLVQVIMSATPMAVSNLVQIRPLGLLGKWDIYHKNFKNLLIPYFQELTYRSDPSTDFHACWLKRHGRAQGCAFCGFR